jgi:hypothetical protein
MLLQRTSERCVRQVAWDPDGEGAILLYESRAKSTSIKDTAFWAALDDLGALVDGHGISKRQKSSEAEKAHVGLVRKRWDEIRVHVENSLQCVLFKSNPKAAAQILAAFDRRRSIQSVALHTVAFMGALFGVRLTQSRKT